MRIGGTGGASGTGRPPGRALVPVAAAPAGDDKDRRGEGRPPPPAHPNPAGHGQGPYGGPGAHAPFFAQLAGAHLGAVPARPGEAARAYTQALRRGLRFAPGTMLTRSF